MKDKHILLGVTGGIAAYKACELCRMFTKAGATVQVLMSQSATEFIQPLTFEALSGRPVKVEMFGPERRALEHIELADDADVMVIAPATADYLARSAAGRASDLISSVTLAFTNPIVAAPAMNTNMWNNPATRRNIDVLERLHNWNIVPPGSGELACGWTGPGRMADPAIVFNSVAGLFNEDYKGKSLTITAGPTIEDIDPVRFLSNRSSGKMGYTLANEALKRGASVILISGPTNLEPPLGANFVPVRSAIDMQQAVDKYADTSDAVIMTAAVADFKPKQNSSHKLKKQKNETERTIELVKNPDILASLGQRFKEMHKPVLVGFALETENLVNAATQKLVSKNANIIVGNLAQDGFGGDTNNAVIVRDHCEPIHSGQTTKIELSNTLLDILLPTL